MLTTACRPTSSTPLPQGYPFAYAAIERAAEAQGELLVWSAIDADKAAPLVADFTRRHPRIRTQYVEMSARQVNDRFLAVAGTSRCPDFLWSSAMDLQIKLVNDGYAQAYASPEATHLADWASWKNEAWGTTAEPIVFVYNRRLISDAAMPKSHAALARFLEQRPPALAGKVATYDLPTSAVGYLYLSQDQQATHEMWRLLRAMAANKLQVFATAEDAMRDIEAGRSAIGYDIIGSYVLAEMRRHPELGLIMPQDYTLTVSRIALIPRCARHPDAAKLFLDHLLSRRGQSYLAAQFMPSVRPDLPFRRSNLMRDAPLRSIRVGPGLLVDSDQLSRAFVTQRWNAAISRTGG